MKINYHRKPSMSEKIKALEKLVEDKQKLDDIFKQLETVLGTYMDTPLHDAAYMMFDHACEYYAKAYEIALDDLVWFIFDTECGSKPQTVTITIKGQTESVDVDSVESFIKTCV